MEGLKIGTSDTSLKCLPVLKPYHNLTWSYMIIQVYFLPVVTLPWILQKHNYAHQSQINSELFLKQIYEYA